ncbi:MAG: hypothetical protein WD771_05085 [Gemmatimonadaceae bacterium]
MERETVIANLRAELAFTDEVRRWMTDHAADEWFARDDNFLMEYSGKWKQLFVATVSEIADEYFARVGLSPEERPKVRIGDAYKGSFVIEAYLIVAVGIPAAYALLKGASELPQIADGLEELKQRLAREYQQRSNAFALDTLREAFKKARERGISFAQAPKASAGLAFPAIPPLTGTFSIDARPLRNLRPHEGVEHRVHMAVALTTDSISLENLGDTDMQSVRLGLFVGDQPRNSWAFVDAFYAVIPRLSARQTLSKDLRDFRHSSGVPLSVPVGRACHVDCWVQDNYGIYLFNFLLVP